MKGGRPSSRTDVLRTRVAEEAARIMREQGVRDFHLAKRKAAERLRVVDRHALPRNLEISAALAAQQRLFCGAAHERNLRVMRAEALRVMRLLDRFTPRLVGPVLEGTATPHTAIYLHLFAGTPEDVALLLIERAIRYRCGEKRLRIGHAEYEAFPSFELDSDVAAIEALVLPDRFLRQPPWCPVSGRPMRRAASDELARLLAA